jgi:outer membrane protein assembly factor BamD (BamD/ComL family)
LSRELKTLELAHQALAAHNPRTALGVLDRYRAQFPEGRLASEAVLLRVQALVAIGDRAGAQALADAYAAANPGTPYARRLKEIVQGQ